MLLTSIATDNRGTMISTGLICPQHFFWQGLLKIYQKILVKFEIAHYYKLMFFYGLLIYRYIILNHNRHVALPEYKQFCVKWQIFCIFFEIFFVRNKQFIIVRAL